VCTASWLIRPDGYELFFNRDERNERSRALGPERLRSGEREAIAPTDADAGGTWLGVNDLGLGVGLLNAWDASEELHESGGREPRSRGLLVRELLAQGSQEGVRDHLERVDLTCYRGFRVLAFAPGLEPVGHRWDGRTLASAIVEAPVSSSSFEGDRVRAERRLQFKDLQRRHGALEGLGAAEQLELFHGSHYPERGPYSVCMHRGDASTVSSTHIQLRAGTARMRYADGPPCESGYGAPLLLPLRTGETANP